ncbi:disease resistance protein RGA2 [Setaria italica]|nr:disease resistance protein RGA2 [Setaria italica]
MSLRTISAMHASAVVKVARDKLVTALGDAAVTMPEDLRRHLEELKGKMETMVQVLGDAERRSVEEEEEEVREWLMRLEDAAYGIWDMVDEIQANNKGAPVTAVRCPCLPTATARKGWTTASTMDKAKENIEELLEQHLQIFAFRRDEQSVDDAHTGTECFVDEEECIVGREGEKQEIMADILSAARDSSRGLFVLAICGVAGLGKTTIAKMVFSDTTIIRDYARAWVYVGQEFDLKKIGNCILSQLSNKGEHQDSSDVELIMKRLDVLLGGGKKVLIVLDDLWDKVCSALDGLKRMLGAGKNDSKVIVMVTTRTISYGWDYMYETSPLSVTESMELIYRKCGFASRTEEARRELQEILHKIAIKCMGLPSAIHVIGYTLRSKTREEIISVLNSNIWKDTYGICFVSLCLLSYQCMPPNLRLCFAYCAIFPRGHSILKDDLVHHWTALQLIEPSDRLSTRQVADKYIGMLLGMSFLQHSVLPPSDDSSAVYFTLNYLIYDIARWASWGKLIILDGETCYRHFMQKNGYRYARLTNSDVSQQNLSGILSALFHGCSNKQFSDDSFSSAKYLCVLDLRDCWLQKLPDSICQLRQLRYLNLSGSSELVNLPDSFGNLLNLGHIDLSGCSQLLELPASFSNLTNVMHIDLSGCSGLSELPASFGNLTNAMHIDLSGCSGLLELPASFGNLTNAMHIDLSGCSGLLELPASFGNLTNAVHIDLSGCIGLKTLPPESFGVLKKLEHLDLSSCSCLEGIPSVVDGLTNLQHLNLSHPCCYLSQHRFHLKALKYFWVELINLRYLNLSMCLNPIFCYLPEKERIEYIESISCLHNLEHLDLSHNIFLFDIPESLGLLSQLQTLNLSGCSRLKKIEKWMGERNCPKKSLVVSNCLGLERYQFVVHTEKGANRSNLAQLKDVSCKEVEISRLEKVISTEEAQNIGLTEKKKLQKLALVWSAGHNDVSLKDGALLAELVPPQNLQYFELHGYSSEYLPAWLTSSIFSHLPNLVEVTMVDIPSCSNLPSIGVLPNLQRLILRRVAKVTRIDAGYLSGGSKAAFRRLMHVTLDGMINLKELDTYSSSDNFVFPTLDELVINKCPKLRFGDSPPKTRMLVISDCDQLMMYPEKRGKHDISSTCTASAPVTEVVIESCEVPLHSLHIRNCSEKIISPEIMKGHLLSLQLLSFSHCASMTNLPEHVVQDTSIKELVIHECHGIKSLPQSICEEKKKRYPLLRIRDCPELKKWYEKNITECTHIHFIFE